MARSGNYRVQLRRRREGKTDYQARKALVLSGKPRLVTRGSLKNITVQISIAKPNGDEVLASANSHELGKSYGWKAPSGNISAAYLTGYLCGLKAKTAGVKEAILDIGLIAPTKGAKPFAALSGVVDAGVEVPHSEEKIVKERMKGEHVAKYAKSLGVGSEEYNAKFSKYIANGVAPEKLPEHFNKVKGEITAAFKGGKPVAEEEAPKEKPEKPAKAETAKKAEKAVKPAKEKAPTAAKEKAPKKEAPKKAAPKQKAAKKGEKKA